MSKLSKNFILACVCAGFLSGPCFAFDDGDFQWWTSAGASFEVLENMTGEVFYLWQTSRAPGDWNDTNVLGTRLKFRF